MFGKSLLINLCAGFLLCSSNVYSVAVPVRRSVTKFLARELIPLVPGASIHPVHVDLMDRYENLERQVSRAVEGTPDYESLVNDLATTKRSLEDSIKGIAVLARSDTSNTAASPSPSSSTASASVTASASTISVPPSTSVNTDVPVVTVVTQIGTSVVVVASQGVTSTVTLATLTNIPSSTPSSTAPSGSGSASGTSLAVSASSMASTTPSGTIAAQQNKASSAASPMALSMPKTQILLGTIMSTLFGALTVL